MGAEIIDIRVKAQQRAERIRHSLDSFASDVLAAWEDEDWRTLGYESWAAYCQGEIADGTVRLAGEHRDKVVEALSAAGMSVRAIGAATGSGKSTVQRAVNPTPEVGTVPNGTLVQHAREPSPGSQRKSPATGTTGTAARPAASEAQDAGREQALRELLEHVTQAQVRLTAIGYACAADSPDLPAEFRARARGAMRGLASTAIRVLTGRDNPGQAARMADIALGLTED